MARKSSTTHATPAVAADLSETERDLLSHLQDGYELETDSLGGDPLLRRLKDRDVIRPLSATRNTVEALEKRGLIAQAKGGDPLRILWKLSTPKPAGTPKRMMMRKKATHRKKR